MTLWAELKRRNVIRVALAYGALGWFLVEVASLSFEAFEAPAWGIKLFIVFVALGFPFALFFAWAFELTPEGLKRESEVDRSRSITRQTGRRLNTVIIAVLLGVIGLLLLDRLLLRPPSPPAVDVVAETTAPAADRSVAVLPFINMSGDEDNAYFADGITEELLNLLADIDGLRVPSRTSSFAFKGRNMAIGEIARELGVAHVLEGSVRKAGDRVRVTAQLIDVASDAHLWSETYDRQLEDIFAIQDDISGQIVSALQLTLGTPRRLERASPTRNMAAHELYLRGLYEFRNRGSEESLMTAVEQLEQAVALDPGFAQAAEALAMTYLVLPGYQTPEQRAALDAREALTRARLNAERALELDPGLVEARAVQALATARDEPVRGLELFEQLIDEHPDNSTARLWFAIELMKWGHIAAAREQMAAGVVADPVSGINHHHMAKVLQMAGEDDAAMEHVERAVALGRISANWTGALIALERGDLELFRDRYERVFENPQDREVIAFLCSDEADDPQARTELVARLSADAAGEARWPRSGPFYLLGAVEAYFDHLPLDAEQNVGYILDTLWFPLGRKFRQHPRFQQVARELGMVDLWEEYGWPDLCRPAGDGFTCD